MTWIDEQGEKGLVSVIVPVHNRAELVVETLDSIWAQTYRPIELIVVDDGSTDESLRIVEDWAKAVGTAEGFRMSVLAQQQSGAQVARNRGLKACRGEYIHLFDSDDIMAPQKLTTQVALLTVCPSIGFVVGDIAFFTHDPAEHVHSVAFSEREHTGTAHLGAVVLDIGSTLYRRHTVALLGPLDEELSACQDFEYNFRLFANGVKGVWLPECLALIRRHGDSITARRLDRHHESLYQACVKVETTARRHGMASPQLLDAIGKRVLFYLAVPLRKERQVGLSLRYFVKAWRTMCWRSRLTGMCHWLLGR